VSHARLESMAVEVADAAHDELSRALREFGVFASAHEAFAVLFEEVDEFWDHVKLKAAKRDLVAMERESIQIAAMGLKLAVWCRIEAIKREKAAKR